MKKIKAFLFFLLLLLMLSACGSEINVVFMDYDSKIIDRQTVKNVEQIKDPTPSRVGYSFEGWKIVNTSETMMTYIAEYSPKIYTISFESIYEDFPDLEVSYDQNVEFPKPTMEAYKFKHFTYNGVVVKDGFKYTYDKNITMKAEYDEGIASVSEFTSFIQGLDDLLSSSDQYRNKITMDYDITVSSPNIGSANVKTSIVMDQKLDYKNLYFEATVYNDDVLTGFEILKSYQGKLYLETLIKLPNYFELNSSYAMDIADYKRDDAKFNDGWKDDGVYNKLGDHHYKTTAKFGDLTGADIDLSSIAAALGIHISSLEDVDIIFEIEYKEDINEYKVDVFISNLNYSLEGIQYDVDLSISFEISECNKPIKQLNYDDYDIYYVPANSPEEVNRVTDSTKAIESFHRATVNNQHWYMVEFEEGIYTINLTGVNKLNFGILDTNMNNVSMNPLWNNSIYGNINTFIITEPGFYYINILKSNSTNYWMTFTKQDYIDYSDYINPSTLEDINEITIEGQFDYIYYNYKSNEEGYLTISLNDLEALDNTNLDNVLISVNMYNKEKSTFSRFVLEPDLIVDISIDIGDNYLMISSYYSVKFNFNASFTKN